MEGFIIYNLSYSVLILPAASELLTSVLRFDKQIQNLVETRVVSATQVSQAVLPR
jgi:hypothetical protein